MKKYIAVLAVLTGAYAYSQEIPRDLKLAVKMDSKIVADTLSGPDFTYYSKNYDKVFGPSLFTEDYFRYSRQTIFINTDYDKSDFNHSSVVPHIFTVMPLAGVNVDACRAQPDQAIYSSGTINIK